MNPPLAVIRYLAQLDAALAARAAPDRDQIVTQVAEHIADALGEGPDVDDATVAGVLAELGDPQRIADEAAGAEPPRSEEPRHPPTPEPDSRDPRRGPAPYPAAPYPAAPSPAGSYSIGPYPAAPKVPLLARQWIPIVAVALWTVGAGAAFGPLLLLTGDPMLDFPTGLILLSVLLNIPLVASAVVVICSPLFRAAGRVVWVLSVPVAVLAESIIGQAGLRYSYYGSDAAIAWLWSIAGPITLVAAVVGITVRAYRRATGPPPAQPLPATPAAVHAN